MASYNQGAQVEHQTFGLGTVLSHTEERIVIKFDDHGEKKFVTAMVITNLKKSDRQPPAERERARGKPRLHRKPAQLALKLGDRKSRKRPAPLRRRRSFLQPPMVYSSEKDSPI